MPESKSNEAGGSVGPMGRVRRRMRGMWHVAWVLAGIVLFHQVDHASGLLGHVGLQVPRFDNLLWALWGEEATFWYHDIVVLSGSVLVGMLLVALGRRDAGAEVGQQEGALP